MQIANPPFFLPMSFLLAPLLVDASSTTDTASAIQQWVSQFSAESAQILQVVNTGVSDFAKVAWFTLLVVGFLLYFAHIHKRLGRELVAGGIVLAILVQFIFPLITKL